MRKKGFLFFIVLSILLVVVTACGQNTKKNSIDESSEKMKVTSTGLKNGEWEDKFGKRGIQFNENNIPNYSIPFKINNAPSGTKSYAIILEDKDAYPVTKGITWIHWLAANITKDELNENESINTSEFVQGANSWMTLEGQQQSQKLSSYYGGMAPPDKEHIYELHVFALDAELPLNDGFMYNELFEKMEKHILDIYTLKGKYDN